MLIDIHHETARGDIFTLKETLAIVWREKVLVIPDGFESDGASVPRFLWGSVSPQIHPSTLRGAVAHDFIYRNHPDGWTRKEADELFYDLIREDGLSWRKAQKAYWGVRLFGNFSFQAGKEKSPSADALSELWRDKKGKAVALLSFPKESSRRKRGRETTCGGI